MFDIVTAPEILIPLLAMSGLLLASGFFSASETALFFLSAEEVQIFQRSARRNERRAAELLADPNRLLTAILFWNLMVNVGFFATGLIVTGRLNRLFGPAVAGTFGVINLALVIVFGEVLPKSSAVLFRKSLARHVSLPLSLAVQAFDPLAPALRAVTRSLRRMFWPSIQREQYLDPSDLEKAIENSAGDQFVIQQERHVLHNILDLTEIPIEEVMRPRGSYIALKPPIMLQQLRDLSVPVDYVVVLRENGEDIEGVVPLLKFTALPEVHLEDSVEDVVYVPWCAPSAATLQQLDEKECSVACVVNEFGETIGIVTYEDIVDTILSSDPHRASHLMRRDPVLTVGASTWQVESITSLRYLSRRLNVEFDPDVDRQVTVAGLFHEALERIPDVNDECFWMGYRLRVIENRGRGRFRALVTKD